jgi:copper chaperone NosL
MVRPWLWLGGAVVALLAAASCHRDPVLAPPEVRPGRDACDYCGMSIVEDRFAAATLVRAADGSVEPLRWDDVGCIFWWEKDRDTSGVLRRYVRDHDSLEWIEFEKAWFLRSEELQTPMGSGIASFSTRARAEAAAEKFPGVVLDAPGIRAKHAEDPSVLD